jgi:hypothetical protein
MVERDFIFVNCQHGQHRWVTEGGRPCPEIDAESVCPIAEAICARPGRASQTVYRCEVCGEYDYGDPGGPGHKDCSQCIREWVG